jgi:predicted membrane protein
MKRPFGNQFFNANSLFMKEQENTKERDLKPNSVKAGWKRILNYQSIVKQVPFFLFLALLAVVYIYNGHYADKTIRNINQTAKEVKELQYEYKTVKSEVMFRSKQSELARAVEPLGLKELTIAPVVLKDTIQ